MEDDEYDLIFKVLLVGDSGVGKTNITTRFVKDQFDVESKATIGVEYASKKLKIDGMHIKAQIWDTAGQERYQSITRAYYRGSKGAFIVFDITKKQSFNSIENWLAELKKSADHNITVILLGNKSDLDADRQVSTDEALMKAKEYGIPYMETSAKTSVNIEKAFLRLVEEIYEKFHKQLDTDLGTCEEERFREVSLCSKSHSISVKENKKGCC